MMRILATLALASLLGGCRTEGKPTPTVLTPDPPVAAEGIVLAETEAGLAGGQGLTVVNFATARDLWLRIPVKQPANVNVLTLSFYTPDRVLYFWDRSVYSPDTTMKMMDVGFSPQPVFQVDMHPDGSGALDRGLPISGSIFRRMPNPDGAWGIEATLDGVPGMLTTTMMVTTQLP